MEFLDNLILGRNTPRYADESTFPSKTFKKNICRKKHCDKSCLKDLGGNWEFWALALSCKQVDNSEIGNRIMNMKGSLRFSVWYKLSLDGNKEMRVSRYKEENEEKNDINEERNGRKTTERDQKILRLVFEKFRYKKIDEERLFNTIIRTLKTQNIDLDLYLEIIFNILDLPFADTNYLEEILGFLNGKLKFDELFLFIEDKVPLDVNNEEMGIVGRFVDFLTKKEFMYFCKIIDLVLCYQNTTFKDAMLFILKERNGSGFESLISVQNLNKLKDYLENKQNTLYVEAEEINTQPTYYDFIVVQNETIKAQEHIKKEYIGKITELENDNKELRTSLDHFKKISASLEEELTDYQDVYVKEITKLLDETKKENDTLEKEVLRLKNEICKIKRSMR